MYEMVFELREFLAEQVYTCFFTNFYFEHAGRRLNEYSELSELDLETNPRIVMKPGKCHLLISATPEKKINRRKFHRVLSRPALPEPNL